MEAAPQDLQKIDQLLDLIHHCSPADEIEYAEEQIQGARIYLLGAMPVEFRLNLELAKETLARMDDSDVRRKAQTILDELTASRRHLTSSETGSGRR